MAVSFIGASNLIATNGGAPGAILFMQIQLMVISFFGFITQEQPVAMKQ
jgi:hypothetical protein